MSELAINEQTTNAATENAAESRKLQIGCKRPVAVVNMDYVLA